MASRITSAAVRLGGGLPASYWKLWAASAASNLADGVFQAVFLVAGTMTALLVAGRLVITEQAIAAAELEASARVARPEASTEAREG